MKRTRRQRKKPDCCRFDPRETVLERLKRRVLEDGPDERCRNHGSDGGSHCVGGDDGCAFENDWFCPGCSRWMCYCRGGEWGDLKANPWIFRLCDSCWFRAQKDEQARLLRVLCARGVQKWTVSTLVWLEKEIVKRNVGKR